MPSSLVDVPINSINMKFDTRKVATLEELASATAEKLGLFQDEVNRQNRQLFDILLAALGTSAYVDLITQSQISNSISSQSGTIGPDSTVTVTLSPYTFYPAVIHKRVLGELRMSIRIDLLGSADADIPFLDVFNPAGAVAPYEAEWRHIDA